MDPLKYATVEGILGLEQRNFAQTEVTDRCDSLLISAKGLAPLQGPRCPFLGTCLVEDRVIFAVYLQVDHSLLQT